MALSYRDSARVVFVVGGVPSPRGGEATSEE